MKKIRTFFGLLFWFVAWEFFARAVVRDFSIFPSLFVIGERILQLLTQSEGLWLQITASAGRFSIALIVAAPAAYALALLSSVKPNWGSLIESLVRLTYPLPKVALIPFLLLVFGTGPISKIVLIGLGMFYLIYLSVAQGARELLGGPLNDVSKIYQFCGGNYWYQFLLRGTLPAFLHGLTGATGYGLTLVVVSEMSLSNNGLGYFIWSAWDSFRIIDMYAGLFFIGAIGFLLHSACARAQQFVNFRRGLT